MSAFRKMTFWPSSQLAKIPFSRSWRSGNAYRESATASGAIEHMRMRRQSAISFEMEAEADGQAAGCQVVVGNVRNHARNPILAKGNS